MRGVLCWRELQTSVHISGWPDTHIYSNAYAKPQDEHSSSARFNPFKPWVTMGTMHGSACKKRWLMPHGSVDFAIDFSICIFKCHPCHEEVFSSTCQWSLDRIVVNRNNHKKNKKKRRSVVTWRFLLVRSASFVFLFILLGTELGTQGGPDPEKKRNWVLCIRIHQLPYGKSPCRADPTTKAGARHIR